MHLTIVFYRPDIRIHSPAITLAWPGKVIDLFNRLSAEPWFSGYDPDEVAGDFVRLFLADRGVADERLRLMNLPIRTDRFGGAPDDGRTDKWKGWFLREIEQLFYPAGGLENQPILVDLDPPYHVTQRGELLFRRVDPRTDRFEHGKPLWTAPGQGPEKTHRPRQRLAPVRRSAAKFEADLGECLEQAGFDFRRPDLRIGCKGFLKCCWEPAECDLTIVYYEVRDGQIEIGRSFHTGQEGWSLRHERVGFRFTSSGVKLDDFTDTACLCANPDDRKAFERGLRDMISEAGNQEIPRWKAELRHYTETFTASGKRRES